MKIKHLPKFKPLGNGRYEFMVPGLDETTYRTLAEKLTQFGGSVVLQKPTE